MLCSMAGPLLLLLLATNLISGATCGSLIGKDRVGDSPCCQNEDLVSCVGINLNTSVLGSGDLELEPLQETLQFQGMVGDSKTSYHYSNDNAEMIITYHENPGSAYGHITLNNGKSFVLEYCGKHGHVIKEFNTAEFGKVEEVNLGDNTDEDSDRTGSAPQDNTTVVTYTVKIYYTQKFQNSTSDVSGFIDEIIAETNQGYINTQVPIRLKLHCIEKATVDENNSSIINQFLRMKGTVTALRGTADAASLLIGESSLCSFRYVDSIARGNTISITSKKCANYYYLAVGLGSNIGLSYTKGYSHPNGKTIMLGHSNKINFYSNPAVNYKGSPVGIECNNNAETLIANRYKMAAVGDESESCVSIPRTTSSKLQTTTTATTTSTTTTPATCGLNNTYTYSYSRYIGKLSSKKCRSSCCSNVRCYGWFNHKESKSCFLFYAGKSTSKNYVSGSEIGTCVYNKPGICSNEIRNTQLYIGYKKTSSACECEEACKSDQSCDAWRWYKKGYCYRYQRPETKYNGWSSGSKCCCSTE